MTDPVPFLDLNRPHAEQRDAFDAVWRQVVDGSGFIGGPLVERFEADWAAYCGTSHCVGLSDGTAALELAMAGLGIGAGDEVIVPANTFVATVEAVAKIGATPVLADVDPATLLLTAETASARITPRTAAIIAVHLYGQPCDMDALGALAAARGLALIEDAAQAHGATWRGRKAGSLGAVGCFSFYPGKNLGAFGDAGAVVTDDAALAERIRERANHGRPRDSAARCVVLDGNHRLDALQAGVLGVKLARLDDWNAARRATVARYTAALAGSSAVFPTIHPDALSSHHLAVVLVPARDEVRRLLGAAGIATGVHYPIPCHKQEACAHLTTPPLPVVEAVAERLLSLPLFPQLTLDEERRVTEALAGILAESGPEAGNVITEHAA